MSGRIIQTRVSRAFFILCRASSFFSDTTEQRSKSRVQDLLKSGKGSVRDKLRLLGVYCLAARPSTAEVTELEGLLKQSAANSGVDGAEQEAARGLGAIDYLRQQVGVR